MFPRPFLIRFSVVWIMLIIIGSFLPSRAKVALGTSTLSRNPVVQHRAKVQHSLAHLGAFGIAALALALLAKTRSERATAFTAIAMLSLAIEFSQMALHGGHLEYWDIRDDTLAAITGSVLGAWRIVRAHLLRDSCNSAVCLHTDGRHNPVTTLDDVSFS